MTPALLVFCADTEIAWLRRLLRPGFRHVFVALPVPGGWITVDPLATRLEVAFHPLATDMDLAGWFRAHGHLVLPVPRQAPIPSRTLLAPLTCVSVAKRILGIDAPLVLTPWQLYRHLGGGRPVQPRSQTGTPNTIQEHPIMARLVSTPKPRATATPAVAAPLPAAPPVLPAAAPAAAIPAATAGEQSLLRRATGRAGTVLTGWQGVLTPGTLAPTRKTLLGE
ncbi:hypothetical protein [Niveispirillum fermenti]|uniref:hypothetical protein n=1 Tax=Niveispirillum fermenti TaxID=1233113 RepID=UPI003A8B73EB